MTKKEFLEKLKRYNMSNAEFANLIGYHPQTVKQWGDGDIPYFIEVIFNCLEFVQNIQNDIKKRTKNHDNAI